MKNLHLLLLSTLAASFYLSASPGAQAQVSFQSSASEGVATNLPVCSWQDKRQACKGMILLVHGITEQGQTLHELAHHLAEDGYRVYAIDLRGHGWWHFCQSKGEPGYKCDYKSSVKDIDALLPVLKAENPNMPLFMIGESCGAAATLRAAVNKPDQVNGIVLAGVGYKKGHAKVSWLAGDILKNFYRPNHQINILRYQLRYGTEDVPALEEALSGPEVRSTMSLSEILKVGNFVGKNKHYARDLDPAVSVLVLQGALDQTLRPKSAQKVFDALPSQDKKMVVIPDCGHVLIGMNKLKPQVLDAIEQFVDERSSQQAVAAAPNTVLH